MHLRELPAVIRLPTDGRKGYAYNYVTLRLSEREEKKTKRERQKLLQPETAVFLIIQKDLVLENHVFPVYYSINRRVKTRCSFFKDDE